MKTDNYRKHSLLRSLQASLVTIGLLFVLTVEAANVAKDLAYPLQKPNANEIAQQVYFVNRFYAFSNASLESHPRGVAEVINQQSGEKFSVLTVERHINNTYKNEEIRSRELTIFRSGKLKGSADVNVRVDGNLTLEETLAVENFCENNQDVNGCETDILDFLGGVQ